MARRERILAYGSAAGLVLGGGLCGWLIPGIVGEVIRLSMITVGLGAVLLLVFYEIGLSEDRERAREDEERRRRAAAQEHEQQERRSWRGRRPRRPG